MGGDASDQQGVGRKGVGGSHRKGSETLHERVSLYISIAPTKEFIYFIISYIVQVESTFC